MGASATVEPLRDVAVVFAATRGWDGVACGSHVPVGGDIYRLQRGSTAADHYEEWRTGNGNTHDVETDTEIPHAEPVSAKGGTPWAGGVCVRSGGIRRKS